jgi:hypothetical protein
MFMFTGYRSTLKAPRLINSHVTVYGFEVRVSGKGFGFRNMGSGFRVQGSGLTI